MSARIIITCDAVHPERTPPACRAFVSTAATSVRDAYREAARFGWDIADDEGRDICASCSRKEVR